MDVNFSEHNILPSISPNFILETVGNPFFVAKEGSLMHREKNEHTELVLTGRVAPRELI